MTAFLSPLFLISNWSSVKGEWFLRYKVGCWRQRMAWYSTTLLWWARAGLQDPNISYFCTLWDKNPTLPFCTKNRNSFKKYIFFTVSIFKQPGARKNKHSISFALNAHFFFSNTFLCVIGENLSSHWLLHELQPFPCILLISSCAFICFLKPHSIKINVKLPLNSWLCVQPSTKALWYDHKPPTWPTPPWYEWHQEDGSTLLWVCVLCSTAEVFAELCEQSRGSAFRCLTRSCTKAAGYPHSPPPRAVPFSPSLWKG